VGSQGKQSNAGASARTKTLACLVLLLLGSCNTIEVGTSLPLDWWAGAETLLVDGVWADIVELLGMFLPI